MSPKKQLIDSDAPLGYLYVEHSFMLLPLVET